MKKVKEEHIYEKFIIKSENYWIFNTNIIPYYIFCIIRELKIKLKVVFIALIDLGSDIFFTPNFFQRVIIIFDSEKIVLN